jgi:membrane-associated phospholipid phosphatase
MPLKSLGTMGFIAVFFLAYFYVLKNPAYPVTVMPVTMFDNLISFQPQAFPLYVSLWVYVSLPPAFLASRRELYVHGLGMTAACLTGLVIFYFWPSAVPPATVDWALYPGMEFLKNLDAAGNACPSLHVATAVFSGFWLHHLLRRFGAPGWALAFNWLWCLGITYSTIATRQHVAVDVGAGFALGAAAGWLSLRWLEGGKVPASPPAPAGCAQPEAQAVDLLT